MGTNYYAVRRRPTIEEPIHIGKSSAGWLFHFQTQNITWRNPEIVWNTYNQVKQWLHKYVVEEKEFIILNEYDKKISYTKFCKIVDDKQKDKKNLENPDNFSDCKNIDGYRFSDYDFS